MIGNTFKKLFSFSKNEVETAFELVKPKAKMSGFKLLQAKTDDAELSGKLLIVIPKKSGSATTRNFLRRQIKSIFYQEKLFKKPSVSIIIVYAGAKKASFAEIKNFLVKNL